MAINYERVGWDTSNFVNPTNMNQMDKGIKDACDGVDGLKERIGVADISEIGDGTVKGAIKDVAENRNLRTYTQIADLGLSISATLKDIIKAMPKGSTIIIDPWNPLSDFPIMQSGYWVVRITRGYSGIGYVDIYATLHNADGSIARHWIGHYLESNDTIAWVEYLPLTGGTLSGNTRLEKSTPAFTLKNTDNDIEAQMYVDSNKNVYFRSIESGSYNGFKILPYTTQGNNLFKACASNGEWYLFGEHNKPSGSYTGNGSATARTINTGGICACVLVYCDNGSAIITPRGAFMLSGTTITSVGIDHCYCYSGDINLTTNNNLLNANGTAYKYQVI